MVLAAFGTVQAVAGLLAVRVFVSRPQQPAGILPGVTILKPVCGDEPWLEEAIASFCVQAYPRFQLVIGAQDPDDPALTVARRLQTRFPQCDIRIVADFTQHGSNRKIANLMNMLPLAKHDLLVFADSDLHVKPDYLLRIVTALQQPRTGLVTTINRAVPAVDGIPALLGAMHLSHSLLPGALLARALGRQDCLGCTMALRRETLEQAGGLAGLVKHLADDNVLGQKVRRLGLSVRLAATVPVVTVQEQTFRALWQHELRWARTIRALVPVAFAASALQFPLFWGLLAIVLSGAAAWAITGFAAAWVIRGAAVRAIDWTFQDRLAREAKPFPLWLLPARDILSVLEIVVSHWSNEVVWRGHTLHADVGEPAHTGPGSLARPVGR